MKTLRDNLHATVEFFTPDESNRFLVGAGKIEKSRVFGDASVSGRPVEHWIKTTEEFVHVHTGTRAAVVAMPLNNDG